MIFLFSETYSQNFHFTHLGISDGLSQSSVYTIFQDSHGFMWFGTGDGLNRYDGYEIKTYRNDFNPKVISHNNFYGYKAVEDITGNIFFSSRAGIVKYNFATDLIEHFYPQNDTARFTGEFIVFGIKNTTDLWFCNASDSIYSFNLTSGKINSFKIVDPTLRTNGSFYRNADMDTNGMIWYTLVYGIGSFDTKTYQYHFYLSEYYKKNNLSWTGDFLTLANGDLILACYKKVLYFSPAKETVEQIISDSVNSLYFKSAKDKYGNLWLASLNNGLACLTKDGKKIIYKNNPNDPKSISGNLVSRLFIDRSNNLWIGVDGQGVDKINLNPPKFKLYQSGFENTGKLGTDFIKCFFETDDGKLIVGTHDGGISILDRKNNFTKNFNPEKPFKNTVSCFTKDSHGRIIIASSLGLSYFDPSNGNVKAISSEIASTGVHGQANILSMCYTKDRQLLVGTTMGIFGGQEVNGTFNTIKNFKLFGGHYIYQILQASDKTIWISAMGHVFHTKYENGDLQLIDSVLFGNSVRCITEDVANHILWMASENGLIKYFPSTKNYSFITTKDGLANNYLYGVVMDENGNLWLSSNKGLMCYHPKSGLVDSYEESDGLQSNEFNTGSFYKSRNGELFFGGIKGFNSFFASDVKPNMNRPEVVLTKFNLFDKPYREGLNSLALKEVSLSYFENTISFEFAALEFTNSFKNEYEYMLTGEDENWVRLGNKHDARYSGLKPGKYIFKVKACNNDHIWNAEKALLLIIINPPWWQTWWFIIIATATLIIIGLLIIQLIINRKLREQKNIIEKQKAVEEERSRISKDMHDDIGSGLSKIAIMSELMKTKVVKDDKNELKMNVEKISLTASDLVDNMSQIVWAMNPQNDTLENMIAYIREFTLDYFDDFNLKCHFDFPDEIPSTKLSQQVRRNIFLVVKETLNNTLKYAEASTICLVFRNFENHFSITISDDGKGFDTTNTHRFGNGLMNMKKRMEDIDGQFSIESKPGYGSKTVVVMKI